jgi:hypothetical protein
MLRVWVSRPKKQVVQSLTKFPVAVQSLTEKGSKFFVHSESVRRVCTKVVISVLYECAISLCNNNSYMREKAVQRLRNVLCSLGILFLCVPNYKSSGLETLPFDWIFGVITFGRRIFIAARVLTSENELLWLRILYPRSFRFVILVCLFVLFVGR